MALLTNQRITSRTEGSTQFQDYFPGETCRTIPTLKHQPFTAPTSKDFERTVNAPAPLRGDYDPGENTPAPARPRDDPSRWTPMIDSDYIPQSLEPPVDLSLGFTRTGPTEYTCATCQKTTNTITKMEYHLTSHRELTSYKIVNPLDESIVALRSFKKKKKKPSGQKKHLKIYPDAPHDDEARPAASITESDSPARDRRTMPIYPEGRFDPPDAEDESVTTSLPRP